jgi:OOP family OmpA-OmpF porin
MIANFLISLASFRLRVKNFLILWFLIVSQLTIAQSKDEIIISGQVKAVASGKGVKARITYKSIPTGGLNGSFNDSTFQFSVFGSSKYLVMASADNYIPRTILIDPKFFDGKNQITRDLVLTPRGQTIRLEHLLFEQRKSEIDPQSYDELDEIVALLKENQKMIIQLEGHTDNLGNVKANMDLSQERVDAVKKYLTGNGIERSRVKTKAFGGKQPITKEKTAEAKNLNRRVEMRVLSEN